MATALGAEGALAAEALATGPAAGASGDRIIYDSASGGLFYDHDGTGASAAIQVAQLASGLALTVADFEVI